MQNEFVIALFLIFIAQNLPISSENIFLQEQSPRNFEGNWFDKFYQKLYIKKSVIDH
jgi:hypothetical protein